jgi:hypothetical protein
MARIRETITVAVSRPQAFDYVADFTTTPEWDPAISDAERLGDDGPVAVGTRVRVRYSAGPLTFPLVYEVTRHEPHRRVVLRTSSPFHLGEDDVRFIETDEGTLVEWNALFRLRGPGRLIDPLLAVGFRRVGAETVVSLERALTALGERERR